MSTLGRPVSQVTVRSASRSASRWTLSINASSSRAVSCCSGRLRSWLRLVVKPFTSSPAMPMMTWLERKPAISSASWSATWQLSTTAAMSATVPDCMCARPLPLAADAAHGGRAVLVDIEHERLGELGAHVERRARGKPVRLGPLQEAAPEGHARRRPRAASVAESWSRIASQSGAQRRRAACRAPGPSPAGRRRGHRSWSHRC